MIDYKKYFPVLSLTVLDAHNRILLGVRNPQTNDNHPNVISTPTQRFPLNTLTTLVENYTLSKSMTSEKFSNFPQKIHSIYKFQRPQEITSEQFKGYENFEEEKYIEPRDEILYEIVNNLLCRKLGLANYLVKEEFNYTLSPRAIVCGSVPLNEEGESENLAMFNAHLVTKTPNLIPKMTASYSHLEWIDLEEFQNLMKTRNVRNLSGNLDNTYYCAQGLCLISAKEGLEK